MEAAKQGMLEQSISLIFHFPYHSKILGITGSTLQNKSFISMSSALIMTVENDFVPGTIDCL